MLPEKVARASTLRTQWQQANTSWLRTVTTYFLKKSEPALCMQDTNFLERCPYIKNVQNVLAATRSLPAVRKVRLHL